MFRSFLLASFLVFSLAINDFESTHHTYEFFYHDLQNLLLVVHEDSCYYAYIADNYQVESRYLIYYRSSTEHYVERLITDNSSKVQSSDLETMRAKFQDLLADFHCLDKRVYSISLNLQDVESILNHHHSGNHQGYPGN